MDKSLDELAAEGNKGKRRREDYGRRQGGGDRRDGRVRRGAEGATREAYCFFGDSFVRLFGLVCHPEVSVKAFKGATCRGLGKDGNENRVDITRRLAAKPETKVAIFTFGNVDVHFSYYYSLHGKAVPHRIDFESIARDYVDFVASLPGGEGMRRGVVAAYPSSLVDDGKVPQCLSCYGILTEAQAATIPARDCELAARQGRVREFNAHLARCCAERGVEYFDLFDELVEPDTLILKKEYLDISELNIHVIWETTLLLWLQRLPFLKERTRPGFEAELQASLAKYIQEKKHEFASKELTVARAHPSEAARRNQCGDPSAADSHSEASRSAPTAKAARRAAGAGGGNAAPAQGGEIKVRSLAELLAEKRRKQEKLAAPAAGAGGGGGPLVPPQQSLHTEQDALFD